MSGGPVGAHGEMIAQEGGDGWLPASRPEWPGDRIPGVTDPGRPALSLDRLEAVVFDTDGVLTDTARVHAAAWRRLFDECLAQRAARRDEPFRPFEDALAERGADVAVADLGELALQGGPVRWGGR
jgi:hypothetical protein